jgi:hypothetical protein
MDSLLLWCDPSPSRPNGHNTIHGSRCWLGLSCSGFSSNWCGELAGFDDPFPLHAPAKRWAIIKKARSQASSRHDIAYALEPPAFAFFRPAHPGDRRINDRLADGQ